MTCENVPSGTGGLAYDAGRNALYVSRTSAEGSSLLRVDATTLGTVATAPVDPAPAEPDPAPASDPDSAPADPAGPAEAAGSAGTPAPSASSAPAGSPTSPEATSADQALTPPGASTASSGTTAPRRAPSQQSRPGPQDDIMLATGKPRQAEDQAACLTHPPQRGGGAFSRAAPECGPRSSAEREDRGRRSVCSVTGPVSHWVPVGVQGLAGRWRPSRRFARECPARVWWTLG